MCLFYLFIWCMCAVVLGTCLYLVDVTVLACCLVYVCGCGAGHLSFLFCLCVCFGFFLLSMCVCVCVCAVDAGRRSTGGADTNLLSTINLQNAKHNPLSETKKVCVCCLGQLCSR